MKDLRGKLALVTGASSGIGEAIAIALAQAGTNLILCARDAGRLAQVQQRCIALGVQAEAQIADVADEAQMQALAEAVHARHAAIDILINNAGVVMGGLCWEVEAEDWRRLHEINVMGVVHGIRAFVPKMIARSSGGHIVNMASVSGFVGAPGMATYSASKFAVMGLSESLRADLYRHRIGVSTICPGFVKTPIQSKVKLVGTLDTPRGRARVDRDFAKTTLLPETVAQRTLSAIRNNLSTVGVGREARIALGLKRWAPALLERFTRG
ncbi:SDR family NAD(P)-dependent oxidoreductase [Hydrocarboniphaga sp.]|uniref:SDR family NAD(P)-dependent oxidoreductase n=1 Tax=Hydrocarboniphaga sp. TaxID=2033016 RepID=UPI003D0B3B0E